MSKTYAIADLHGRFDLLVKAFSAIAAHPTSPNDRIITLGDYVDRGPESRQIIDHLMAAQKAGMNLICLKGNHEDMMVETLRKPLHPDWWVGNGGGATLVSYGHPRSGVYDPSVVPESHIAWLRALPTIHIDKHRVYVHAGADPTIALNEQKEEVLLWWLYPSGADLGHSDRHVVHGHEQFGDGPICLSNRTDLDTFAWATGRLVVGVFDDDKPGGPIDLIEVLADPAPGWSRDSKGY